MATPPSTLTYETKPTKVRYFDEPLGEGLLLTMAVIPGGSYMMGSLDDERDRSSNEGPQHEVIVSSFCMGKYPVTQAQWSYVAENLPQEERELKPDPSRFEGEMRPVERVNWFEAKEFCARLATLTGRGYRLPSEAEWEYACRAGTETPFHFGRTIAPELANYRGTFTYDGGPEGEYREQTTRVDHFKHANAFGLYDMHGNVWEWCEDQYHSSYKGAPNDGSAWVDDQADEQNFRIRRGGSWASYPRLCRSAFRYYINPRESLNIVGFRVVSEAPRALQ